jgi:hypothetical protein
VKALLALAITVLAGCSSVAAPTPTPVEAPTASLVTGCQATDQDQYVYHPARLQIVAACVRVTGTVLAIRREADGDLHIRVKLDPTYQAMLTTGNQQQCAGAICGLLVVEPVCVDPVTQADAVTTCAADTDPLSGLPQVGQHVWLEGRSVLDTQHGSWAELHPLYRFGTL